MREVTKTFKILKYDELSDEAKQAIRDRWQAADGYTFATEAMESLNTLAMYFGGKVKDYQIDFFDAYCPSWCIFEMPERDAEDIAELLEELGTYNPETLHGLGDCVLTGVCCDEWLIDGFREAWHTGQRNLNHLMSKAFDNWLKMCQEDCEYSYSDECMSETCEANYYEFYEDGTIF